MMDTNFGDEDGATLYYHSFKLVCQRSWIPFFQLLSVVSNNAYIVHRKGMGENALAHKGFSIELV